MTTTTLPKIFEDVLATRPGQLLNKIATPWSDGEYIYATTSIIIVRIKAGPELLEQYRRTDPMPPNPKGLSWNAGEYLDEPLPLPAEPVDTVGGWTLCDECDGTGECPRCGEGPCDECSGDKGRRIDPEPVAFAGIILRAVIVRFLQDHKATVYRQRCKGGAEPTRLRFVCGDVEGIAMLAAKP